MNYLVTGGAGFIGSHIVQALLKQGDKVRVFDNFSSGKRENLKGLDVEVIEGDLRDASRVAEAVRGMDIVFHEAAFVSVPESMEKPQECFDVNVTGTSILFEAARKAGVRRAVIASSAAVYGDSTAMPLVEDTPLRQLSPYATSKRVDEKYAQLFTEFFGFDVVALRYFNVYGPRQRPDSMYAAAVPIFIRRILDNKPITIFGDGGQSRDLVNVRDVVQANLLASQHPAAPGQIFNVCTGVETRLLDLLDILYELFPNAPRHVHAEPRAGDIYRSIGTPKKIMDTLGFKPQVTLADGLHEAVEEMRGQK
ncbi:MAG TPA: NAD-dependent epimerase/dehydratase family protein [Anaerolineales bacterium]|nr:NAD-dependent epimerase/dehydratase family protein [Anaerolineales bacterium]HMV95350.1 NAD-dependent epimerase/dehydratase family protein [Anaerolineales bacterium]HMX17698.1 NAD-dependent epimerase/dehydratase family protein [Anaerolineales bacterium]HMX73265.1 NAD-dependent epimerase/dehydratase family protein [Anaerolineales bacterium]HMZ42868.1 NAD-dependent epimerase/dehydratase family protein [Anaerolineales bacterium]